MKSSLVSAMIHLGLVALVVLFTPHIGDTRQRPPERPTIVIYRPPPPETGPTVPGKGGGGGPREIFQAPKTVPPEIPPIDVSRSSPMPVNPESALEFGNGEHHSNGSGPAQGSPTGVLSADIVDIQVTPYPGAPTPKYPETMRSAGVEGEVTIEFVVDTTGRVEAGSIRAISSSAEAFVISVCDALNATKYHPALVAGRRVRQLVRQRFVFSLTQH